MIDKSEKKELMEKVRTKYTNYDVIEKKFMEKLAHLDKEKRTTIEYNYDSANEGKLFYIENCKFNEYGELIIEPTIPDGKDKYFITEFNRSKTVSSYAYNDGINAAHNGNDIVPDKYLTYEELQKRVYLENSNIEIDEVEAKRIKKEINKRFDKYASLYYKFYEAGYIYGLTHKDGMKR